MAEISIKFVGQTGPKLSFDVFQDGTLLSQQINVTNKVTLDNENKTASIVWSGSSVVLEGYPFPAQTAPPPANDASPATPPSPLSKPLTDSRLVWNFSFGSDKTVGAIYSWGTSNQIEVVEGMIEQDGQQLKNTRLNPETKDRKDVFGVPSIMNPHAYLVLSPTSDNSVSNELLVDTVGAANAQGKLWYESGLDIGKWRANSPTTHTIINWSRDGKNEKRAYKFSDFAFCKYWKKIPNNYMITLRRFPFPVNDGLVFVDEDTMKPEFKLAAATMVTWLGEETGNTLASILSFEAGLNWGGVKADVWEQQAPDGKDTPGADSTPFGGAGFAKFLGLASDGVNSNTNGSPAPPDPYAGGPYANKVIGPIDVITSVAKRERGIMFKQSFNIAFHYQARSFGGANTKAIMLDILGNALLMATNTAFFWGGQNRVLPGSGGASPKYPFLGGKEGLAAFQRGDAMGWFSAIGDQFSKAFSNLGDVFGKLLSGDFASVLQGAANLAVKQKHINQGAAPVMQGMRSLLTGDPVGEWHLTVGNPMNPMMVVGNLICKGVKVDFGEELGPDDFPLDVKATYTLEHGSERDRDRIQAAFNFGAGRSYGLPKGYESSFSTSKGTSVDGATGSSSTSKPQYQNSKNSASKKQIPADPNYRDPESGFSLNPLLGDPQDTDRIFDATVDFKGAEIGTAALWVMGEGGRIPAKKSTPTTPPAAK